MQTTVEHSSKYENLGACGLCILSNHQDPANLWDSQIGEVVQIAPARRQGAVEGIVSNIPAAWIKETRSQRADTWESDVLLPC